MSSFDLMDTVHYSDGHLVGHSNFHDTDAMLVQVRVLEEAYLYVSDALILLPSKCLTVLSIFHFDLPIWIKCGLQMCCMALLACFARCVHTLYIAPTCIS